MYSHLYRVFHLIVSPLFSSWPKITNRHHDELSEEQIEATEKDLLRLADHAQSRNMKLMLAIMPHFLKEGENSSYAALAHQAILRIVQRNHLDALDLEPFYAPPLGQYRRTEDDPVHPTNQGYHIAAQAIFEHLQTKGMPSGMRVQ